MLSFIEPCSFSENYRSGIKEERSCFMFLVLNKKKNEGRDRNIRTGFIYKGDVAISVSNPS